MVRAAPAARLGDDHLRGGAWSLDPVRGRGIRRLRDVLRMLFNQSDGGIALCISSDPRHFIDQELLLCVGLVRVD